MANNPHSPRYKEFQSLLVRRRKDAGLTQEAVAKRLSKPQSFVAKYERGERRIDVIEFLEIANAIDFDPEAFVRELR